MTEKRLCPVCSEWPTKNLPLTTLLGHHGACPNAPGVFDATQALCREIVAAIDAMAADTTRVHDEIYSLYDTVRTIADIDQPTEQEPPPTDVHADAREQCSIDVGLGTDGRHRWLQPQDVRSYCEDLVSQIKELRARLAPGAPPKISWSGEGTASRWATTISGEQS